MESSYYILFCIMLFVPLLGSLVAGFSSTLAPKKIIGYFCSICILISFCLSMYFLYLSYSMDDRVLHFILWEWISTGQFSVNFSFMIDHVNSVMIFVVTLVSTMVHFYSIGYMSHDKGFNRFFCYLGAFVFSMLLLVGGSNFLILFIGWEGVGTCSYLLIGFWYTRERANYASMEAFIMNRIADLSMLVGIFLIFITFGSLEYEEVFVALSENVTNTYILVWIGVLLFIGAMGKSAQFPLHTWLANAMEGPTPVSALIHAATMVTAGVYLIIRCQPLYDLIPSVSFFIACLGAFVALFASLMAIVNRDLKRIIAYSTLSQLGYMFVAAGLGAYSIALFHLFTHAFFKSLLFLGAGNVMHAMNDKLDIAKMGNLKKPLKYSAVLMTIGSVALCGIYPFAGFFSKDKILEVAFAVNGYLWFVLFISAGFTAFYSFRLLMLVFFAPQNHDEHPHEASKIMLFSMIPLSILAIVIGFIDSRFFSFIEILTPSRSDFHIHNEMLLIIATTLLVVCSCIAAIIYYKDGYKFREKYNIFHIILTNEYFIPLFYNKMFVKPFGSISKFFYSVIEIRIIDTIVDGVGKLILFISYAISHIQNGSLSSYLRFMTLGLVVLVIAFYLYLSNILK